MVVHDKKSDGEVSICVDLRKVDDVCLHNPFPTLFIYEVLESVAG